MPGIAVTQPSYPDNGQTGSAYPTAIDAITQVMARIATAFNPHAVPAAAAAPVLSSSAGGALGARTYYAKITLVTPAGEVAPSAGSNLALLANTLLNVASPTFALGVTGWNVYVGTSSGNEIKQNASPIAISTAWVEPTSGLISGAALPAGMSQMKVIVDAGVIPAAGALATEVAAQLTAAITAPPTNPRKDIVHIDATTGAVGIATGTEAASPSDPAVPAGKVAVGRINCTAGMTAIANSMIDDLRNLQLVGLGSAAKKNTTDNWDFGGSFALSGDISPSQITANQNDYNPTGLSSASVLRLSTDASRNITGLASVADGRVILLHNIGSNPIVLKDESASSTAANRFALNSDVTVNADQVVWLHYDSTSSRWRISGASASSSGTPSFLAYRSTDQAISNSTFTKVQLVSESWDTDNCFDSVTNYRFTPTIAGKYQLAASVVAQCAPTYKFVAVLYKNGAYHRTGVDISPGITDNVGGSCGWLVDANGTTDYFELYVYQNSGVSKNIVGNSESNIVFGGFRAY